MNRSQLCRFPRFPGQRLLTGTLPLAGALFSVGCGLPISVSIDRSPPPPQTAQQTPQVHQTAKPHTDSPPMPEKLPAPSELDGARRVVPVSLDTVFHLAEEQNVQVAQAREKLNESMIEKNIADWGWLPALHAGMAYWRHEGGIQNEDGTLTKSSFSSTYPGLDMKAHLDLRQFAYQRVNAERQIWQQQGELSRVTSDTLLEAASTYIDLLTARSTEAILLKNEEKEKDVLKWAEALAKEDKYAQVLVEGAKVQLVGREQAINQVRAQGDAATARLAYLLGLSPDVELLPIETVVKPIDLVDANQPTDALVSRALQAGPGVRELEQMVNVIQNAIDAASGPSRFLPIFEACVGEGPYGAGPDATQRWTNRLDMGVQMYWNLTDLVTAKDKRGLAQSRLEQAELAHRDLRGKLTFGVQEAQQTIQSSRKIIDLGAQQIKHADTTYKLSDLRLKNRVEGGSTTDVLNSIRALEAAQLNSLSAIRAYNKAQVRLMVLMGAAGSAGTGNGCK
jgi:outer membrane protein TolC